MITHGVLLIIDMQFLLRRDINIFQLKIVYVFFSASAHVNFVSSVMSGICYSRAFMSYYRSISLVSKRFQDDPKRTRSFIKIFWFSLAVTLLSTFIAVFRGATVVINSSQTDSLLLLCPTLISLALVRITIVIQYFMFYVVIMIVVQLLKCLDSLVSDVQERVGTSNISSDEQYSITREQIQEWVELYQNLSNCCENVALCFGRQVFENWGDWIWEYILDYLTYVCVFCFSFCFRWYYQRRGSLWLRTKLFIWNYLM